jgi:hypothetical protein
MRPPYPSSLAPALGIAERQLKVHASTTSVGFRRADSPAHGILGQGSQLLHGVQAGNLREGVYPSDSIPVGYGAAEALGAAVGVTVPVAPLPPAGAFGSLVAGPWLMYSVSLPELTLALTHLTW